MDKTKKKPIIGILGGIGAGKSTVAAEFVKLGCGLVNADEIAHESLDQIDIKRAIIETFGDSVINSAARIDRAKLADIVFNQNDKLLSLNKIVHPHVLQRTEQLIEQYNEQADIKAIVLDMPLLVEVGWAKRCDRLIFVDCSEQLRRKRAKKAKLFDKNQLKIRENFQISLDSKAKLADNAIDNSSDLSMLTKQVTDIFSTLLNG